MKRIAPDNITFLEDHDVFVFGSNLSGTHGKGAAKTALQWGAKWGVGEGLVGQTYALPTKGRDYRKTLSLNTIRMHVENFILCALKHPYLSFLVTRIGCGYAGYTDEEMAELMADAVNVDNIYLPASFLKILEAKGLKQ